MKNIKSQKGFTLIEILVVIGMIALLATIVLIAINPARQFAQGRNTDRTSNANAILNAIGQYQADHKGSLPAGIDATVRPIASTGGVDLCAVIVTDYMPALPTDPKTGTPTAGTPIEKAGCTSAYNSHYTVAVNADGRVTVAAPDAELSTTISITR